MELHGDVARVMQFGELAKNVGIIDFAGAGMMAAGHVGDVEEIDEIQVLFELGDEVAGRDLLVKEIVEEFDVGVADGTDYVKTFGGMRQKIFGIFVRVEVFDGMVDFVSSGVVPAPLEGFDEIGVHSSWE